jgi:DNA helicase II / ATP-dependent DNA helicase PcrA
MNFLDTLNESQFKAVIHSDGPLFVVAGAGTGKTKTLTTRIAYLIMNNVLPENILAVTFTNKAAREMKERVIDMVGPHGIDVWLYTFHAFGLKFLREHIAQLPYGYRPNFAVIDEEDARKIIQEQIKSLALDTKKYSLRRLKNLFSLLKCGRINKIDKKDEQQIFEAYVAYLRENQLLDFDDLLIYTHELLKTNEEIRTHYQYRFQHILVDEFQDTDAIQYDILKMMGLKQRNIFVVGDPDQSIYGFRGASYTNNYKFIEDFGADQVILEENYRSTNLILETANQLISYNINRPSSKNLESGLGQGVPPVFHHTQNDYKETYFVVNEIERLVQNGYRYEDMAILYRNNALSRLFEDAFIKQGIPYMIYGGLSFYERKEIKDALAYIRTVIDPNQDFYLKRIINVPRRALGNVSIQKLEQTAKQLNTSMFRAIEHTDLTKGARSSIDDFKTLIEGMQSDVEQMTELDQVMPYVLNKTGYLTMLRDEGDEIADDRINNLKELQNVFARGELYYEGSFREKLTQLLDQIALYTELDKETRDTNRVKLSTVHQVKGLEFRVVFIVVLEEGIFPSEQSLLSPSDLEEERRVCYVAVTRAKERLYLSYANQRMIFGSFKYGIPSRFVQEMRLQTNQPQVKQHIEIDDKILSVGDRVNHDVFGLGVVVRVDEEIATIAFGMPHGIKKLLESHPSIRKIKK